MHRIKVSTTYDLRLYLCLRGSLGGLVPPLDDGESAAALRLPLVRGILWFSCYITSQLSLLRHWNIEKEMRMKIKTTVIHSLYSIH